MMFLLIIAPDEAHVDALPEITLGKVWLQKDLRAASELQKDLDSWFVIHCKSRNMSRMSMRRVSDEHNVFPTRRRTLCATQFLKKKADIPNRPF